MMLLLGTDICLTLINGLNNELNKQMSQCTDDVKVSALSIALLKEKASRRPADVAKRLIENIDLFCEVVPIVAWNAADEFALLMRADKVEAVTHIELMIAAEALKQRAVLVSRDEYVLELPLETLGASVRADIIVY